MAPPLNEMDEMAKAQVKTNTSLRYVNKIQVSVFRTNPESPGFGINLFSSPFCNFCKGKIF